MTDKEDKKKAVSVKQLKEFLTQQSEEGLQKLIVDLYALSVENRNFISTQCYLSKNTLDIYEQIIGGALYPKIGKPLKLSMGRKAISDYKKASGDEVGVLDIMVYYVEMGTKFTLEYGDIYEEFYDSLESMFKKVAL